MLHVALYYACRVVLRTKDDEEPHRDIYYFLLFYYIMLSHAAHLPATSPGWRVISRKDVYYSI